MRLWVRVKVNIYIVKMFFNCMEMMQTDKSESDVSTPLPAPVGALRTAKASTDTLQCSLCYIKISSIYMTRI